MEAPGVYVVGKEKFEAIFICSPRSQPFRFSRSRGRAVSSVQHLNLGIDTGDDQRFFESKVSDARPRQATSRDAHVRQKNIFFFAPLRVKGEALSGGWSPHMDYPDGPSTQDSMMLLIMSSIFAGNLQFCYNLISGGDFIGTLSIFLIWI